MNLLNLTVVICTHNRANLLLKAVESIYSAIIPSNCKIRLIVIANACNDDTVILLESFKENKLFSRNISFDYYLEPIPGKSHALNHSINLIEDGYICFIDDDQIIDTYYFDAIISAIEKYTNAFIFCGRIFPDWKGDEPEWVHLKGKYRIYPLPFPFFDLGPKSLLIPSDSKALPSGGNCIIHKSVFNKIGVFSTLLGPNGHNLMGSEDTDFFQRAIDYGESIRYIPDIKQLHYVDKNRLNLKYLLVMCFKRNLSITASSKYKTPAPLYLYRQLISNLCNILFSFNINKLRFNLMRCFSTLGEIFGHYK